MAVLQILHFPDERLRTIAKPVENIDEKTNQLIDDMIDTMYHFEGIGLAATQVNVHLRIVVIDVSDNRDEPLVLINPELLATSGAIDYEEGCLSVPDFRSLVSQIRAESIKLSALDRTGTPFELEADGILAICIQHELDHLKGKLFIDYISPLKRQRLKQKIDKMAKSAARQKE